MAPSSVFQAKPFTSPDGGFYGLGSISEDNHDREPSASPETYTDRPDYFGLEGQENPPQRRTTYPIVPSSPSDVHPRGLLSRSSSAYQPSQKDRTIPPPCKRTSHSEPNLSDKTQSRRSTICSKDSLSFAETAIWDQKAILSLDGGGIRGYSALLILQELMTAVGKIERAYDYGPSEADGPAESSFHPLSPSPCTATGSELCHCQGELCPRTESSPWLPCHYFDYVAGTSTGGLIGIMLGRLRMNIDDCIREYESLGAKVFGHERIFHTRSPLWWPRDKYNHRNLEDVLRDVVRRRVPKVAEFPGGRSFAFDENRCRTVVVAFQQKKGPGVEQPYLFRTYKNLHKSKDPDKELERNPDMAHDIPIWQVARATSAAPTYFQPMVIDQLEYIDGGFGANNPCVEIYNEVRRMNNNNNKSTKLILSIGTGKSNKESRFNGSGASRYLNYLNFARKWASESQTTHSRMLQHRIDREFNYFRFNVEEGLGQMKLDEWRARGPKRIKIGCVIGKFRSANVKSTDEASISNGNKAGDHTSEHIHPHDAANTMTTGGNGTEFAGLPSAMRPDTHARDQTDVSLGMEEKANASSSDGDSATNKETAIFHDHHGHLRGTRRLQQSRSPKSRAYDPSSVIPPWFRPKNETLDTIRKHTHQYLSKEETRKEIELCARLLVEGRRGRAKNNPARWEKACFGAWYQCTISECSRGEKEYGQRHELKKHLLHKHRELFTGQQGQAKVDEVLDTCKIIVH